MPVLEPRGAASWQGAPFLQGDLGDHQYVRGFHTSVAVLAVRDGMAGPRIMMSKLFGPRGFSKSAMNGIFRIMPRGFSTSLLGNSNVSRIESIEPAVKAVTL